MRPAWVPAPAVNVSAGLHAQLKGSACRAYSSDLRIRVLSTGLATYPDVSVICGAPDLREDGKHKSAVNPTVLIEVASPSTAAYDRGV